MDVTGLIQWVEQTQDRNLVGYLSDFGPFVHVCINHGTSKNDDDVLPQMQYSPNHVATDYYLFGRCKTLS